MRLSAAGPVLDGSYRRVPLDSLAGEQVACARTLLEHLEEILIVRRRRRGLDPLEDGSLRLQLCLQRGNVHVLHGEVALQRESCGYAGRMAKKLYATASSPLEQMIE